MTQTDDDTRRGATLAWRYFWLAGALVTLAALINPPLLIADENRHFFRAIQVSHGGFIGQRLPGGYSGGMMLQQIADFGYAFKAFRFAPWLWISQADMRAAFDYRWAGAFVPTIFQNTVVYPPVFYLPAAISLFITRHLHLHLLQSLYIARLTSGWACVYLSSRALRVAAAPARGWLLLCLCLPEVTGLFGSVSQDGPFIACTALACALLSRCAGPQADGTPAMLAGSMALLAVVAADKPPYVMLLAVPLLLARDTRLAWRFLAPALLLPAAWWLFGIHPLLTPYHDFDTPLHSENVSPSGQFQFLLAHPGFILTVLYNTFIVGGMFVLRDAVATVGWVDAGMPRWFYNGVIILGLALAAVYAVALGGARTAWPRLATLCLIIAATVLGITFAMYLIWDPVAMPLAWGTNGRYFTPLFFLLAPGAAFISPGWVTRRALPAAETILLTLVLPAATALYLAVIFLRFWWPR